MDESGEATVIRDDDGFVKEVHRCKESCWLRVLTDGLRGRIAEEGVQKDSEEFRVWTL